MGQIKDDHYMYRALEEHFVLYLKIFKLYLKIFVDYYPMIEKDIREGIITSITCLKNCLLLKKYQTQRNHDEALHLLNHLSISLTYYEHFMNNLHTSQSSSEAT